MTFNEDDFIEVGPPVDTAAARVEAERRWPLPDQKFLDLYAGTYTLRGLDVEILNTGSRDGFIAGAVWQAAQPVFVTRAQRDQVVRAIQDTADGCISYEFEQALTENVLAALNIEVQE